MEDWKKMSFLESSAVWKSEITDLCNIPKEWGLGCKNFPVGIPITCEGDSVLILGYWSQFFFKNLNLYLSNSRVQISGEHEEIWKTSDSL